MSYDTDVNRCRTVLSTSIVFKLVTHVNVKPAGPEITDMSRGNLVTVQVNTRSIMPKFEEFSTVGSQYISMTLW